MVQNYSKSKPFLLDSSEKGFTILEFLVANGMALIVIAVISTSILSVRDLFHNDIVRTRVNQNLRGAVELVGSSIRLAGENLYPSFPSIEVIDGVAGAPDEIILRRNLLDEVLKVCETIDAGDPVSKKVVFAKPGNGDPGCIYDDNTGIFNAWQAHRTSNGGTALAFIYDPASKLGEFFSYDQESDTGDEYRVHREVGDWQNTYTRYMSGVYIMQEWRFRMSSAKSGVIELIENEGAPIYIAPGITDFQVRVTLKDGTQLASFSAGQNWTEIKSVELTITGQETALGKTIERTLVGKFFPRNVLSHD